MFTTLFSVTLFAWLAIQGALADFSVETPKLVQCQDVKLNWQQTKGPYNLLVVKSTDPCGNILADLGNPTDNSFTWKVNFPAGKKLMFSVEDATGAEGWSQGMIVGNNSDSSCLNIPSPAATADSAATTGGAPVAVGAANAGNLPFGGKASGALPIRHLNTPVLALSALFATVAAFTL